MTKHKHKKKKKNPNKKNSGVKKWEGNEEDRPLLTKQLKAVEYYLSDPTRDKFKAYKRAGYTGKGATGKTGCHLLFRRPNVRKYIKRRENEDISKIRVEAEITREWVLRHLKRVAEFDPRKLHDIDNTPKKLRDLDDETAMALSSFDVAIQKVYETDDDVKKRNKKRDKDTKPKIKGWEYYLKKVKKEDKLAALRLIIELMRFNEQPLETPEEYIKQYENYMGDLGNSVPPYIPHIKEVDSSEERSESECIPETNEINGTQATS